MPGLSKTISMRRQNAFVGGSRRTAHWLALAAMVVLHPAVGRSQAMLRGEPALLPNDPGGPSVSVNGNSSPYGDPTVRQAQPLGVGPVENPSGINPTPNVIDLSESHGPLSIFGKLSWRPVFYLITGISYNDNIFIRPQKVGDTIFTIEPGIILGAGNYQASVPGWGHAPPVYDVSNPDDLIIPKFVYLDYHPTVLLFDRNTQENSVDESVTLLAGYAFSKLTLGAQAQYLKLSGDDVDAGGRVKRNLYTADVTSTYGYSDKTSWDIDLYGYDREYQSPYTSSTQLENRNFLNYQYGPKTNVSAGATFGYVDYRGSTNQTYEQLLLRVRRAQLSKLDFTITGGVEFRQDSSAGDTIDGVFDLDLSYALSNDTSFSLRGSRATEPSALESQEITYTRIALEARQRLFSRVYLTLSGAYANADYQNVNHGSEGTRTDDTEEIIGAIDAEVTQYAAVEFSYVFRNNTSTAGDRQFTENLGGVQVRLSY